MQGLPASSANFNEKKSKILSQLSVPDAEYSDASPKGSVDEGIRDLLSEINGIDGLVTTSSCAGRVSVFAEGKKTADARDDRQVAGVGGKGAGGAWLFVSHESVPENKDWINSLELTAPDGDNGRGGSLDKRLIHFKFEPMILHILTASLSHAQLILRCALQAGFRESGAVNLTSGDGQPTPMVAVRSMGLSFESLIGHQMNGRREWLVSMDYLDTLMTIANERFAENTKRIERFRAALQGLSSPPPPKKKADGGEWEDSAARRERKRAEGLRRKAELQGGQRDGSLGPDESAMEQGPLVGF